MIGAFGPYTEADRWRLSVDVLHTIVRIVAAPLYLSLQALIWRKSAFVCRVKKPIEPVVTPTFA